MKALRNLVAAFCCLVVVGTFGMSLGQPTSLAYPAPARYRLDASESKFIAHALRGGLLWFKGHDHLVAASQFSGEAEITPDSITPAALRLAVKTESMRETNSVFTDQQKQIIDKELREIVLLPAKYPEIVFLSTDVKGKSLGNGQYDLKIGGDLTLNGVTRRIVIPEIGRASCRARGELPAVAGSCTTSPETYDGRTGPVPGARCRTRR